MAQLQRLDAIHWYLNWGMGSEEQVKFTEETERLVSVDYNDRLAFSRPWEYWTVLRHLKLDEKDTVLDAGALRTYIPGVWMAQRARRVDLIDNGQFISFTDPNAYSFDEWAKEIKKYPGDIRTYKFDMRCTPFPCCYYDVIVTFSTLEHIGTEEDDEDTKASKELRRILKPGGIMIGTVDFGRPEDAVGINRLYDNDSFHERIVEPLGWEYIARAPTIQEIKPGTRSAMLYILTKV